MRETVVQPEEQRKTRHLGRNVHHRKGRHSPRMCQREAKEHVQPRCRRRNASHAPEELANEDVRGQPACGGSQGVRHPERVCGSQGREHHPRKGIERHTGEDIELAQALEPLDRKRGFDKSSEAEHLDQRGVRRSAILAEQGEGQEPPIPREVDEQDAANPGRERHPASIMPAVCFQRPAPMHEHVEVARSDLGDQGWGGGVGSPSPRSRLSADDQDFIGGYSHRHPMQIQGLEHPYDAHSGGKPPIRQQSEGDIREPVRHPVGPPELD